MKFRYTNRAEKDLEELLSYIEERSPPGAQKVWQSISTTVLLLLEHPEVGTLTSRPHVRVKMTAGYPYKVFYRVRGEAVEILRVRHAARRPWGGAP